MIIPGLEKEQNQVEYIDEMFLEGETKPENEIQLIDQMEILPLERSNLIVQNIDNLVMMFFLYFLTIEVSICSGVGIVTPWLGRFS